MTHLKNHTAELSSKQQLLPLSDQGVDGEVLSHVYRWLISKDACGFKEGPIRTVVAGHHAVNTKTGVLLLDLARLDRSQGLDRTETRVLSKCHRDGVQGVSEGAHGVLFNSGTLLYDVSIRLDADSQNINVP